jgi:hypothetical protein
MLRRMLLMATVGLVMAAMVALSALPALAVVVVPPHQHFLTPANGEEMTVGPQVCTNPQTLTGFSQFHLNVHLGTPNQDAFQGSNPVSFRATGC